MSHLGTPSLSWRRFDTLLSHLPPDCALHRSQTDDALGWTLTDHLLAMVADLLALANWQRMADNKIPRPKPIPRPGMPEPVEEDTVVATKTIGTARPVEEIRSIFGLPTPEAAEEQSGDGG